MINHYSLAIAIPEYVHICRNPQNVKSVRKSGRCEMLGSSLETIWTVGGIYPWQSSAQELFIASSDNSDSGGVLVWGFDANNELIVVEATVAGQSAVSLGSSFVNVDDARAKTDFDGNINVGFGTFTNGVPATQLLQIVAGAGSPKSCFTTVPNGYACCIDSFSAKPEEEAEVKLRVRHPTYGTWWDIVDEHINKDSTFYEPFPVPEASPGRDAAGNRILYTGGTQIEAVGSAADKIMTATFQLVLIESP